MDNEDSVRKVPHTWKDYLKNARDSAFVFRWIWKEVATPVSKKWAHRMIIALLVATIFSALQPRLISAILDGLIGRDSTLILVGLGGTLLCLLLQMGTGYFQSVAREWILGINVGALDRRITELFFEKSAGQHVQESSTLNIGNIDRGRQRTLDLCGMLLFEGIPTILMLACSYLFLSILSPLAGLIMGIVIVFHLVWALFLNKKVAEVCIPLDKEFRHLNRRRLERWEKIERVKTSAKESQELSEMNSWFDATIKKDRAFWLWFIGQCSIREIVNILGLIIIMCWGAWLVWQGVWEIGLLYPLYSWTTRVKENIWKIGAIEHQLSWNMPSVRSKIEALSIKPDIVVREDAEPLANREFRIVFDDVSHSFPPEKKESGNGESSKGSTPPVLRGVSFTIEPGEKVALIGPSGVGKTSIMRLMLRFMDPTNGRILVGERDLRDIPTDSWLARIGYIPQREQVFDGTIKYNLIYGLPEETQRCISDDELWEIMRLLEIDFGERLTDGLATVVGRSGVKLSGGQCQRLMIGAAVLKIRHATERGGIMVIDEATSNLDSTTERKVQRGLEEATKGAISALVVAHRLSTVRKLCGKFVVLKNAGDVRNGDSQVEAIARSFEELYTLSPTFQRLATDQDIKV